MRTLQITNRTFKQNSPSIKLEDLGKLKDYTGTKQGTLLDHIAAHLTEQKGAGFIPQLAEDLSSVRDALRVKPRDLERELQGLERRLRQAVATAEAWSAMAPWADQAGEDMRGLRQRFQAAMGACRDCVRLWTGSQSDGADVETAVFVHLHGFVVDLQQAREKVAQAEAREKARTAERAKAEQMKARREMLQARRDALNGHESQTFSSTTAWDCD